METKNDVLHSLNKLNFVGYLESDDYEKCICIKKVLTDEFQDVNSEKLTNIIGVIDDLQFSFISQKFHDNQILTNIVRGDFFLLVKEVMRDKKIFSPFDVKLCVIKQLKLINVVKSKRKI